MKRSRHKVGLLALSTVSILSLAACYEEKPKVSIDQHNSAVYASLEACLRDASKTVPTGGNLTDEQKAQLDTLRVGCVDDWDKAKTEHAKTAPKFSSLAQCEAEFGTGNCGAPGASAAGAGGTTIVHSGSGDSMFMPMMMGYMLGSMNSGSSHPVYSDRSGNLRGISPSTTSSLRNSTFVSPTGSRASTSSIKATAGKVSAPAPKATMSTSTRAKSGGFGASRSFSGSRSSFGG